MAILGRTSQTGALVRLKRRGGGEMEKEGKRKAKVVVEIEGVEEE